MTKEGVEEVIDLFTTYVESRPWIEGQTGGIGGKHITVQTWWVWNAPHPNTVELRVGGDNYVNIGYRIDYNIERNRLLYFIGGQRVDPEEYFIEKVLALPPEAVTEPKEVLSKWLQMSWQHSRYWQFHPQLNSPIVTTRKIL